MKSFKNSPTWLCIVIVLFLAAPTQQAVAQIISTASWGLTDLNTAQQGKVTSLQQRPGVANIQFVNVGDLSAIQQDGWIALSIPGKDCTANIRAKHVESYSNGDYFWYGTVEKEDGDTEQECSCYDGTVNVQSINGKINGTFKVDENLYELHDLGDNKRILVKRDYTGLNVHCGNTSGGEEGFNSGEGSTGDRDGSTCPVRVLALYSDSANAALPDIAGTISLTINQTNQALRNSLVSEANLELELVGTQMITFTETFDMAADRDNLIGLDELKNKRNAVDADIVLVFVESSYGEVLGIAGTLTLEPEKAVTVINATDALFDYNTCHELAHLFACRHEPSADPTGPFEHAHDFKTGCWPFRKERNTVMFSVATGNTIQNYSNPSVKYKNKKTGVTDEKENWRQLQANACTVATFRNSNISPLNANITGEYYGCPCTNLVLSAQVSGGAPGPYSYEWHISDDGFNWGNVQSTTSTLQIDLPCEEGPVYVRLKVTSPDGQIDYSFRGVEVAETWEGQEFPCPHHLIGGGGNGNTMTAVSPNPATNKVDVRIIGDDLGGIELSGHEVANITLLNNIGKVLARYEINPIEEQKVRIDIEGLETGIYYIRTKVGDNVSVQKIIKL